MTQEEAIAVFEEIKVNYEADPDWGVYDGVFGRRNLTEILDAYATLLCPKPDPDTGLVPCGCGGKARLWPSDPTQFTHVITDYEAGCTECAMTTGWVRGKQENAVKVWNTAMGWKGSAE